MGANFGNALGHGGKITYMYVDDQPINSLETKSDVLSNHFKSAFTKRDLSKNS